METSAAALSLRDGEAASVAKAAAAAAVEEDTAGAGNSEVRPLSPPEELGRAESPSGSAERTCACALAACGRCCPREVDLASARAVAPGKRETPLGLACASDEDCSGAGRFAMPEMGSCIVFASCLMKCALVGAVRGREACDRTCAARAPALVARGECAVCGVCGGDCDPGDGGSCDLGEDCGCGGCGGSVRFDERDDGGPLVRGAVELKQVLLVGDPFARAVQDEVVGGLL
eukprot:26429-Pleurochrysis_carterae.AAC.2